MSQLRWLSKIKTFKPYNKSLRNPQNLSGLIIIALIVGIGVKLMFFSHAASPWVAVEAENGRLTPPATVQTDPNASGGKYVQFGGTSTSGGINPAPSGPAVPTGGWSVAFGDDFSAPLGTGAGQDNLWYPSRDGFALNVNAPPDNSGQETESYNPSQISVSGGNLVLTAKYDPNTDSYGAQRSYLSGMVTTPTGVAGYKGFTWTPGGGQTWAFEIDSQFPPDPDSNLWTAFWASTPGPLIGDWTNERDFFEGHNTITQIDTDWIYATGYSPSGASGSFAQNLYNGNLAFDPSAAMHRYTYVVYPNQSWSLYIDGALQTWVGTNGVAPVQSNAYNVPMELLINYALRSTTFTSGTRSFLVHSVAVYEDTNDYNKSTPGFTGGGLAPGTTIN